MAEMTYQQCPFCGWCRPIKYGGRVVQFNKVDPEKIRVLQTRRLTGTRAHQAPGGHISIVDAKTLKELPSELKDQIKNQCQKILKALA